MIQLSPERSVHSSVSSGGSRSLEVNIASWDLPKTTQRGTRKARTRKQTPQPWAQRPPTPPSCSGTQLNARSTVHSLLGQLRLIRHMPGRRRDGSQHHQKQRKEKCFRTVTHNVFLFLRLADVCPAPDLWAHSQETLLLTSIIRARRESVVEYLGFQFMYYGLMFPNLKYHS